MKAIRHKNRPGNRNSNMMSQICHLLINIKFFEGTHGCDEIIYLTYGRDVNIRSTKLSDNLDNSVLQSPR